MSDLIRQEMTWTRIEVACIDPTLDAGGTMRACRRLYGHDGPHASDFPYIEWSNEK